MENRTTIVSNHAQNIQNALSHLETGLATSVYILNAQAANILTPFQEPSDELWEFLLSSSATEEQALNNSRYCAYAVLCRSVANDADGLQRIARHPGCLELLTKTTIGRAVIVECIKNNVYRMELPYTLRYLPAITAIYAPNSLPEVIPHTDNLSRHEQIMVDFVITRQNGNVILEYARRNCHPGLRERGIWPTIPRDMKPILNFYYLVLKEISYLNAELKVGGQLEPGEEHNISQRRFTIAAYLSRFLAIAFRPSHLLFPDSPHITVAAGLQIVEKVRMLLAAVIDDLIRAFLMESDNENLLTSTAGELPETLNFSQLLQQCIKSFQLGINYTAAPHNNLAAGYFIHQLNLYVESQLSHVRLPDNVVAIADVYLRASAHDQACFRGAFHIGDGRDFIMMLQRSTGNVDLSSANLGIGQVATRALFKEDDVSRNISREILDFLVNMPLQTLLEHLGVEDPDDLTKIFSTSGEMVAPMLAPKIHIILIAKYLADNPDTERKEIIALCSNCWPDADLSDAIEALLDFVKEKHVLTIPLFRNLIAMTARNSTSARFYLEIIKEILLMEIQNPYVTAAVSKSKPYDSLLSIYQLLLTLPMEKVVAEVKDSSQVSIAEYQDFLLQVVNELACQSQIESGVTREVLEENGIRLLPLGSSAKDRKDSHDARNEVAKLSRLMSHLKHGDEKKQRILELSTELESLKNQERTLADQIAMLRRRLSKRPRTQQGGPDASEQRPTGLAFFPAHPPAVAASALVAGRCEPVLTDSSASAATAAAAAGLFPRILKPQIATASTAAAAAAAAGAGSLVEATAQHKVDLEACEQQLTIAYDTAHKLQELIRSINDAAIQYRTTGNDDVLANFHQLIEEVQQRCATLQSVLNQFDDHYQRLQVLSWDNLSKLLPDEEDLADSRGQNDDRCRTLQQYLSNANLSMKQAVQKNQGAASARDAATSPQQAQAFTAIAKIMNSVLKTAEAYASLHQADVLSHGAAAPMTATG